MRLQLIFQEWLDKDDRPTVIRSGRGFELLKGDFPFDAKIELDEYTAANLRAALAEGYKPVFYAVPNEGSGWIPVDDRLPPNDWGNVWGHDVRQGVVEAWHHSACGWKLVGSIGLPRITHWQPLDKPEPPKKGE